MSQLLKPLLKSKLYKLTIKIKLKNLQDTIYATLPIYYVYHRLCHQGYLVSCTWWYQTLGSSRKPMRWDHSHRWQSLHADLGGPCPPTWKADVYTTVYTLPP